MLNSKTAFVTAAALMVVLILGAAAQADSPDVIYFIDGTVRDNGVVVEEGAAVLKYREFGRKFHVEILRDKIHRIEFSDIPEEYNVALGYLGHRDFAGAGRLFESALNNYDSEKQRDWVPQYCLHRMARCLKLQGLLEGDAAVIESAAQTWKRLRNEYKEGGFVLIALREAADCYSQAAGLTPAGAEAVKKRETARQLYDTLEKTAENLLKGERFKGIRDKWTARARVGRIELKLHSGTISHYRVLAAAFKRAAKEFGAANPASFEARAGRVRCEYAVAALDSKGWEAAEETAHKLIDDIAASNDISRSESALLIARLYSLAGQSHFERARNMPKDSPRRRMHLLKCLGAYLRIPLLYSRAEDASLEHARALYRSAQAFEVLEKTGAAGRLLLTLKARFGRSDTWKRKSAEMLERFS